MLSLEVGKAYRATPSMKESRNRIVIVAAREGQKVQLAWVDDMTMEYVDSKSCGIEFCQSRDGFECYTISAACAIENTAVQDVLDLIKSKQHG